MPVISSRSWSLLIAAVKWLLFVIVLAFVGQKAIELARSKELQRYSIQPVWLLAAATLYLVSWLPSVWFWQQLMRLLGANPPWSLTLRAYYYGHLGKYVPGKAAAILVRSSLLQAVQVPVSTSVFTAMIETLLVMGVGLALSIALAPFSLPDAAWDVVPQSLQVLREQVWIGPLCVLCAAVIVMPLASEFLIRFATRKARQRTASIKSSAAAPSVEAAKELGTEPFSIQRGEFVRLLLMGLFVLMPTWLLQGLSLGCVLVSMGVAESLSWADVLLWTSAIGAGNSLGFFVLFAPGGLGVREAILLASLAPTVGGPAATAAAGLLRLVWLVAEVVAASGLAGSARLASRRDNARST